MNTENGTYPTFLKERSTFILLWQVALNKGLEPADAERWLENANALERRLLTYERGINSDIGFPMCDENCDLDDEAALKECEERRYEWLQQSDLDEVLPKLTDRQLQMAQGCASHLWLDQTIEWRVSDEIFRRLGPEALAIHRRIRESVYGPNPRPRPAMDWS